MTLQLLPNTAFQSDSPARVIVACIVAEAQKQPRTDYTLAIVLPATTSVIGSCSFFLARSSVLYYKLSDLASRGRGIMCRDQGVILHDRSTRGEKLTTQEQQLLDAWYREQDQAEFTLLEQADLASDVAALRQQLEAAMQQLALVSQSINEVMRANNELRRDIAGLQAQLRPNRTGRAA